MNIRILFGVNGVLLPNAGMTNRAVYLANKLAEKNESVTFFSFINERTDISNKVEIVKYIPFGLSYPYFYDASRRSKVVKNLFSRMVSRKLKMLKPEIFCVDHPPIDWYALQAKQNFDFKMVYTYHSVVDPDLYLDRPKNFRNLSKGRKQAFESATGADLVIAVSKFAQRQLTEKGIKSSLVYNGVDTKLFSPRIAFSSNYKTEYPTLTYVGRLLRFKGLYLLINAFKKVLKEIPNARLYLVGLCRDKEDMEDWNEIWKLSGDMRDSIFFLGNVSDELLSILYSISDLFVCASLYEGFGMPFLEAQSCGVPCVGFDTTAIPEVVLNRKTGILVEKENVEEMTEAIINLLRNHEIRRRMAVEARKHAETFDWGIVSSEFQKTVLTI